MTVEPDYNHLTHSMSMCIKQLITNSKERKVHFSSEWGMGNVWCCVFQGCLLERRRCPSWWCWSSWGGESRWPSPCSERPASMSTKSVPTHSTVWKSTTARGSKIWHSRKVYCYNKPFELISFYYNTKTYHVITRLFCCKCPKALLNSSTLLVIFFILNLLHLFAVPLNCSGAIGIEFSYVGTLHSEQILNENEDWF